MQKSDWQKTEKIVRTALLIAVMGYVIFLLWYTVFSRGYDLERKRFEGELFWSVRAAIADPQGAMPKEIIYNCLMLVPVGFVLAWALGPSPFAHDEKPMGSQNTDALKSTDNRAVAKPIGIGGAKLFIITAATGFVITCTIEVLQLVLRRGLFEFDDIIYNTIGTIIGYLLYRLTRHFVIRVIEV